MILYKCDGCARVFQDTDEMHILEIKSMKIAGFDIRPYYKHLCSGCAEEARRVYAKD
jgi:hypothetical protein